MRILIANQHRNLVGGVEKYLQAVIPALANRNHQIAVLFETRFDPAQESIDPADLGLAVSSVAEVGVDAALRFAADWKPDVVYSHGLQAANLQNALLNAGPNVLYAHNYYGTCATGQKCHSFPVAVPCDRSFGPACLLLHYPRRCGGLHPGTMWRMYQSAAEMNRQLPLYQAVLVASRHMHREFLKHGVNDVHLLPLPNPLEAAPAQTGAGKSPRDRILFLGRLTKLKGVGHLLQAIPLASRKLGRPLAVTIAGDGPERANLQSLAQKLGVAAEFPGWIHTSQKPELIADADLLAVPSLWPEPFGLVGIEAGAYGVPAVAYEVGGIPDWLIPGLSGELAPGDPPTVEGLADAMGRALGQPDHYSELCRGALQVASRFTLDAHLVKLEEILSAAVCGRPEKIFASTAEGIHV